MKIRKIKEKERKKLRREMCFSQWKRRKRRNVNSLKAKDIENKKEKI